MAEANAASMQEVRSYAFYDAAAELEIIPEMKCHYIWLNPDGWWTSFANINDKLVVLVSNGVDVIATIPKDEDTSVKYKVTFLDTDEVFKELLLRSYQYMS